MRRILSLLFALFAAPLLAQTDVRTEIDANKALQVIRIAVPRPDLTLPLEAINAPFFAPLTRDLAYSGVFAIAPIPPNIPATADLAKSANAQLVLRLTMSTETRDGAPYYVVDARAIDTTGAEQFAKRYGGVQAALTRMAHMIANDLQRQFAGKPGIFESQIAYASNRSGAFEIWLMDWDGANQRQITRHNALSILPSWSADNERLAYTSFARGTSDMYIIARQGGARIRVNSGLNLNTSATFSPISNDIAFVGSVRGNPDIYVIKDDSTNLR